MNIVGVGGWDHDTCVARVCDGRVVAVAEEERFTRVKHQGQRIDHAVRFVTDGGQAAGTPWVFSFVECLDDLRTHLTSAVSDPPQVSAVDHHLCHAESTFGQSGYDAALALILDGSGDGVSTSAWSMTRDRAEPLLTVPFPHSVGALWMATSFLLGCGMRGAGKVMGLAAYGQPRYADVLRDQIELREDGTYRFIGADTSPERFIDSRHHLLLPMLGQVRAPIDPVEQAHMDVAASVQSATETIVAHMLRALRRRSPHTRLCFGGGVGLNSALNGATTRLGLFSDIYVPPNPGDNGTAVGAALALHRRTVGRGTEVGLSTPYLGVQYRDADIAAALDRLGVSYTTLDDLAGAGAAMLAEGQVVGWFQGRAEIGPRALGNRSILADPSRAGMRDRVNRHVKGREWFRPFGPSVLASETAAWFADAAPSPYMSIVLKPHAERAASIPAVVHVDGTSRVQTVEESDNPLFFALISAFHELTGIPMVLNTSFNVAGYPIVQTVENAVATLASSALDAVVIGRCCVRKRDVPATGAQLQP